MNTAKPSNQSLIISYLTLRKALGWLGTLMPFILACGAALFFSTGLQSTLSHYYHTAMGDVFVGILFTIGFFLFSYKGYERKDDLASDLGCVFALGVALFPTHLTPQDNDLAGYLHIVFASAFFITLIYFSLCLFTKSDRNKTMTGRKRLRNIVYKVCAWVMILCMVLVIAILVLPSDLFSNFAVYQPVFFLESIAIISFGISWLVKGETILRDT